MGASPLRNRDRKQAPGAEVVPVALTLDRGRLRRPELLPRASVMVPHWPSMSFGFWKPTVGVNHHHPRACLLPAGAEGGRGYSRTSTRPAAGHGSRRARRRRVGLAAPPARHKAAGATTLESPGGGNAVLAPVPAGVCQWRPRPNASRLISRAINRIWCPSCGRRHAARKNIWPRAARSRRALFTPQRQSTAAPDRAEAQRGRRTSCASDWQDPSVVAILENVVLQFQPSGAGRLMGRGYRF